MRTSVSVPATVANLGPGFDILAIALALRSEVHAEWSDGGGPLTVDPGPGAPAELHDPERNLVARAYRSACAALGVSSEGTRLRCVNRIPLARGLGSSAAAATAGVLAARMLHPSGSRWRAREILRQVIALEGHGDNAAAALLGGLTICAPPDMRVARLSLPDDLAAVVFVPDAELRTAESRQVVARSFSREDAVFNAARCALLVAALGTGMPELLEAAMEDRWHQPARSRLLPFVPDLIEAARAAGAHGAALAGAGPSVIALCRAGKGRADAGAGNAGEGAGTAGEGAGDTGEGAGDTGEGAGTAGEAEGEAGSEARRIAGAMAEAARASGVAGRPLISRVSNRGAFPEPPALSP